MREDRRVIRSGLHRERGFYTAASMISLRSVSTSWATGSKPVFPKPAKSMVGGRVSMVVSPSRP